MKQLWLALFLLYSAACSASEWQSLPAIQAAVEAFVQEKIAAQPGERSVTVNHIDPRLKLAKCEHLEPYFPAGARLWGNSNVGVRCLAPATWSIYVPVSIKVSSNVVVAVRPIAAGQSIQTDDVQLLQRDITTMAGSALTSLDQALDKNVAAPVDSGTILRAEMLRASNVILQGQTVKLIAQGAGFRVTSEGQAMGNAKAGQVVGVKTRSGQIIKGVAKSEGVVEVYF